MGQRVGVSADAKMHGWLRRRMAGCMDAWIHAWVMWGWMGEVENGNGVRLDEI